MLDYQSIVITTVSLRISSLVELRHGFLEPKSKTISKLPHLTVWRHCKRGKQIPPKIVFFLGFAKYVNMIIILLRSGILFNNNLSRAWDLFLACACRTSNSSTVLCAEALKAQSNPNAC